MRVVMSGILVVIALCGCAEEGAVNKARQSREQNIMQEQQRQQERDRIIQEAPRTSLPTTTR